MSPCHVCVLVPLSKKAGGQSQAAVPITVRQLEALVRLSESLAKMRLDSQVQSEDIAEALRLFKVSTMTANSADQTNAATTISTDNPGNVSGIMSVMPSRDELLRAETFLRSRLAIGSVLNKQKVLEEAAAQRGVAVVEEGDQQRQERVVDVLAHHEDAERGDAREEVALDCGGAAQVGEELQHDAAHLCVYI